MLLQGLGAHPSHPPSPYPFGIANAACMEIYNIHAGVLLQTGDMSWSMIVQATASNGDQFIAIFILSDVATAPWLHVFDSFL